MPTRAETVILSAILLLLTVLYSPAWGHTSSTYYGLGLWRDNGDGWSNNYQFTTGFPGGAWRTRINDAFDGWDAVSGVSLHFNNLIPDRANFNPYTYGCPGNEDRSALHYLNLTAPAIAAARVCTANGLVYWGQIIIDSQGVTWWTGTGTVPATQKDLWSAAAHEVGHVTGFLTGGPGNQGHWPEADNTLCGNLGTSTYENRETMCETVPSGTRIMRTPHTHDKHTYDSAYP